MQTCRILPVRFGSKAAEMSGHEAQSAAVRHRVSGEYLHATFSATLRKILTRSEIEKAPQPAVVAKEPRTCWESKERQGAQEAMRAPPHHGGTATTSGHVLTEAVAGRQTVATAPHNLPSLAEMDVVTRANLKEMRQVRRGLRKARVALSTLPLQAEISRQQGEAAGAYIAQRVRRDALLTESRANGLTASTTSEPWRAHLATIEPGSNGLISAPVRQTAEAHLRRLQGIGFQEGSWGSEQAFHNLRARIGSARAAIQGVEPTSGALSPSQSLVAAGSEWVPGDTAETKVADDENTWQRCKIVGQGGTLEMVVLITEGANCGAIIEAPTTSLRRPADDDSHCSVRLAHARQAYDEVKTAVQSSLICHSDRARLNEELSALKADVSALEYVERYGTEQVPLEISRFLRMRIGILQRGRNRRRSERRFPACSRCGKRASGAEDRSNGAWYCRLCE